jgi:hypothetical protein
VTATLFQATLLFDIQTATAQACDFRYGIRTIAPIVDDPARPANDDYIPTGRAFDITITLVNIGSCAWERNSYLEFTDGVSLARQPRFFTDRIVQVGEEYTFTIPAQVPTEQVGLLSATYVFRTRGQIVIAGDEPIAPSIFGFYNN